MHDHNMLFKFGIRFGPVKENSNIRKWAPL